VGFGLVAGAVLARLHGRLDEACRLAQRAHDISAQLGDSYVRGTPRPNSPGLPSGWATWRLPAIVR
jgi:hypothetical protein